MAWCHKATSHYLNQCWFLCHYLAYLERQSIDIQTVVTVICTLTVLRWLGGLRAQARWGMLSSLAWKSDLVVCCTSQGIELYCNPWILMNSTYTVYWNVNKLFITYELYFNEFLKKKCIRVTVSTLPFFLLHSFWPPDNAYDILTSGVPGRNSPRVSTACLLADHGHVP